MLYTYLFLDVTLKNEQKYHSHIYVTEEIQCHFVRSALIFDFSNREAVLNLLDLFSLKRLPFLSYFHSYSYRYSFVFMSCGFRPAISRPSFSTPPIKHAGAH